jgi:hypothetical protein
MPPVLNALFKVLLVSSKESHLVVVRPPIRRGRSRERYTGLESLIQFPRV